MQATGRPEILQVGAYPEWDQAALDAAFTVHKLFEAPDPAAFLAGKGPGVRALATRGDLGADAALIAACPKLEIVAVYGVGCDAVDLDACRARGIRVTNTPDVLTDDVADLAVGLLLALARGIPAGDAFVRDGSWAAGKVFGLTRKVTGMRAGIIGPGRIGRSLARRLAGFDMDIAYCARNPKPDLPHTWFPTPVELAARSDVLFVTLAASAGTRGIVDGAVLDALGPKGLVVNVSRGSNIDEPALVAALSEGRIAGAALDVFIGEPRIDARLLGLPNVVLQPHAGSGTVETRRAMGRLVRDNLLAHFEGRPLPTPVI